MSLPARRRALLYCSLLQNAVRPSNPPCDGRSLHSTFHATVLTKATSSYKPQNLRPCHWMQCWNLSMADLKSSGVRSESSWYDTAGWMLSGCDDTWLSRWVQQPSFWEEVIASIFRVGGVWEWADRTWRCRHRVYTKRYCSSSRRHGVTNQKTVILRTV